MSDQRWAPSYALLADGKSCVIAGGYSFDRHRCVASADLYDESSNHFIKLSSRLATPRDFAAAILLNSGEVLMTGGFNDVLGSLNSAELYNPVTRTFTQIIEHMAAPRELHTATLLPDGDVLVAGGLNLWNRRTQSSAELYNTLSQTFTHTRGEMSDDRFGHAACLMADGRVLVVGGTSVLFGRNGYAHVLASADIYNPATETFSRVRSEMAVGRDRPTATLLPDGKVLVAGGQGSDGASIGFSEIFDPVTETFSKVISNQLTPRMAHCASILPNNKVILTGGWSAPAHATTSSVEEFDPATQSFIDQPPMPFSCHDAAQVVFSDGKVLVAGGKTVKSNGYASALDIGATTRATEK